MSELGDKRKLFTKLVTNLLNKMITEGYQPMIGKDGLKHMKNSLHYEGLAIDIDLCDEKGMYLPTGKEHEQFGKYWELLSPEARWGGRFGLSPDEIKQGKLGKDANHYSIFYQGRS